MNCVGVPERGYDATAWKLWLPQQTVLRLPAENGMDRHRTTRRHGGDADPGEGAGTTKPELVQGRRHAREETFRRCQGTAITALTNVEEVLNRILFPVKIVVQAQAGMLQASAATWANKSRSIFLISSDNCLRF